MKVICECFPPPHPKYQTITTKPYKTKPNLAKPYQISSLYLQLSITAIHNATMPFSEDRDCKPFSACLYSKRKDSKFLLDNWDEVDMMVKKYFLK